MGAELKILRAMLHCPYKAWLLSKESSNLQPENDYPEFDEESAAENRIIIPTMKVTPDDKLAAAAWCYGKSEVTGKLIEEAAIHYGYRLADYEMQSPLQATSIRVTQYSKKAQSLLAELKLLLSKDEAPLFYRNSHCSECQFNDSCYRKLKDRDCISLLPGMSVPVMAKYHNKGLFSITQISHTFRPRRRGRRPQNPGGAYLWDLRALAIREQKTYVIYPPDLEESPKEIFIDFEGLPEEKLIYLIGVVIKEEGKEYECYSYWANSKDAEEKIFEKLFALLIKHPEAPIYHYGSYETQALKHAAKKWPASFKQELPEIEKRAVNALSYFRTHVYPPTYGNGLKEIAAFLGFKWRNDEANGAMSMKWRKTWESTEDNDLKEKLLQYNLDDCFALAQVSRWLLQLAANTKRENVQSVADMKRQSPFKFQSNKDFGEDFNIITKASYFNYQQSKIYWRNQRNSRQSSHAKKLDEKRHLGRGIHGWRPSKINEVVILPRLKKCPKCGHNKLYDCLKQVQKWRQTDLKFTPSGIKQWVIEYQSTQVKCAECWRHFNNGTVRRMLFGDNLFAWTTNLYVNYHISHEMISRLLQEQFGIWTFRQYFVDRQHKWWHKWEAEVNYLWEIIRQSPVIHIDETTVKLSKDRGYVWIFATPHTVFYHFTLTRETEFLEEWLKGYEGVIVTDSFPGYETLKVKQQKCLVHLIRDLNDDLFKNPFDEEYKALVVAFGKVLRKIVETVDRHGLKKYYLRKHHKDIEKFSRHFLEVIHKSGLSIKYAKRLTKHWNELWTFLYHDGVPWNNNNAEAAAKAFAQHRRGVNGQVSEKGISSYLQMLSLAQTCRYRNIPFLDFLRHKAGLWQNVAQDVLPGFLPFNQARFYIHKMKFRNRKHWREWQATRKCPAFIPSNPEVVYEGRGWSDWNDWIGI